MMKEKFANYILLFVTLVFVMSCNNHKSEEKIYEQVIKPVYTNDSIGIADLSDSIEFIPLENKDSCMIYYDKKEVINNGYVYVFNADPYPSIFKFKDNGKYLCKIGKIGHGRGEYTRIQDFTVSHNGDTIIILDSNIIYAYDNDGHFLYRKEIDIDGVITRIESYKGGYVCLCEYKGSDYLLHFYDYKFNKIKELIQTNDLVIKESTHVTNQIKVVGDVVWYYDFFNTSFYSVNTMNKFHVKKYTIKTDKAIQFDKFEDFEDFESKGYDAVTSYFVNDEFICGDFIKVRNHEVEFLPFKFYYKDNNFVIGHERNWLPYFFDVYNKNYYGLISQDIFIGLQKNKDTFNNVKNNYKNTVINVNEKSNYILMKSNLIMDK